MDADEDAMFEEPRRDDGFEEVAGDVGALWSGVRGRVSSFCTAGEGMLVESDLVETVEPCLFVDSLLVVSALDCINSTLEAGVPATDGWLEGSVKVREGQLPVAQDKFSQPVM